MEASLEPRTLRELSIDQDRFRKDFEALALLGGTPEGGVHRPALSAAHLEARRWFLKSAEGAGLETRVDGAGNHSAILRRAGPGAERTLLLGSHLDSVPCGGRFDGALGVLAALEVLRTIKAAGVELAVNLEAIDFTDEEGHYLSFLGSRALTGQLRASHVSQALDAHESMEVRICEAGLKQRDIVTSGRDPNEFIGYLELHIEQGPRLAQEGTDLGIVTGIVGIWSYRFNFIGRRDHAGTMPMAYRLDAGLGASAFALAAREMLMAEFPDCVANVGNMVFDPGSQNVVPGRVHVRYEFRCPDEGLGAAIEKRVRTIALEVARRYGLQLEQVAVGHSEVTALHARMQDRIKSAVDAIGLSSVRMPSHAGHDAQILAGFTPTGMIFVPSVAGTSHSPEEYSRWEDCVNGANALLQVVLGIGLDGRLRQSARADVQDAGLVGRLDSGD